MTVSSTTNKATYSGNGTTTAFTVPFYFLAAADLQVILRSGATETVQTLTTQYTVTGAGVASGGTVTMVAAPASGTTLTVLRNVSPTQETDLLPNDRLPAESLETALDKATMLIQQLDEVADRALQFPASDAAVSAKIPAASARAGKYLGFDATGLPVVADGPATPYLATDVAYLANGSGAILRNVAARLRDSVNAEDFGVVGDGVTDDTVTLSAAIEYAISSGNALKLSGTYKVSGSLTGDYRASGELHLICDGNVRINVAAGSSPFYGLFYFYTAASNNVSINGGSLTVDLNSLCATAFFFRQDDNATQAGTIDVQTPVTILNAHNKLLVGSFSTQDNGGFVIFGNYARVNLVSPTVVGVTRDRSDGVCRGIVVGGYSGEVTIYRPYIKNVLTGTGTADADGIAVAGRVPTGGDASTDQRLGRSTVIQPTFIDCQGRSFKSQCSNSQVLNPYVFRKSIVSIASGVDFDFQHGNGRLVCPTFEYRLNNTTSPLGASFAPVTFQNRLVNAEMSSECANATIVTDVAMPQFAVFIYASSAKSSTSVVDGLYIVGSASLTNTAISRAIVEIPNITSDVVAMSGSATVVVKNVRGPIGYTAPGGTGKDGCAGIGYTGYTTGAVSGKLAVEVSNVHNTMAPGAFSHAIYALSGNKITALDSWRFGPCHNLRTILYTSSGPLESFNFANLNVGSVFSVDLAAIGSVTNAPSWGASGSAVVEVLSSTAATPSTKIIRVVRSTGGSLTTWVSFDDGASWAS